MFKPYPKKIEYLKIAKHLVDNGYSVLMYDLRNHGKSEKGINQWITLGVEEYKDVLAAVNFISMHGTYKNSHIGLLSLCMGSVSTIYAYGIEGGLKENDNIKAFIAVQPQGGVTFLRSFGFSEKQIKGANTLNMERGGRDLYSSFVPYLEKVSVPTMVVQGKMDPWTDINEVKSYYDKLQVEKEMFWIEDADKRFDAYDYFSHSPEKMLTYFNKHMDNESKRNLRKYLPGK